MMLEERTPKVYTKGNGKRRCKKRSMGKGDRPGVKGQMGQKRGAERFWSGEEEGEQKVIGLPRVLAGFFCPSGEEKKKV